MVILCWTTAELFDSLAGRQDPFYALLRSTMYLIVFRRRLEAASDAISGEAVEWFFVDVRVKFVF